MSVKIETIDYHTAEIEAHKARNMERLDRDVSDVALSTWASDSMMRAHAVAIEALKLGAENGIDGPAGLFPRLMQNGREVAAKIVDGQYGRVWLLSDIEAGLFGRRFIPCGANSRIQKQLGLRETEIVAPAKRYLGSASGNWLGAHVSYFPLEADKA
jgi:hypothetical protein